ncbi:hypothetical protein EJ04DRAFT_141409 [Polyplosphaeria fusca]|uniref:Uncharacterized protein n=1 Tax=Polyplosphaeria fusca TaxID=682080 RepID=A0A9P4UVV1_9PLEO|nr:hypothetical protein EJ04DRAFT_141409 [Polyplosphaeria fusca]
MSRSLAGWRRLAAWPKRFVRKTSTGNAGVRISVCGDMLSQAIKPLARNYRSAPRCLARERVRGRKRLLRRKTDGATSTPSGRNMGVAAIPLPRSRDAAAMITGGIVEMDYVGWRGARVEVAFPDVPSYRTRPTFVKIILNIKVEMPKGIFRQCSVLPCNGHVPQETERR